MHTSKIPENNFQALESAKAKIKPSKLLNLNKKIY